MKSENKKLIVLIFIFFLFCLYVDDQYQEWKGEKYVPHRYKNETVYKRPVYSSNGLYLLGDSLWVSSGKDSALLEYDLLTQTVVQSIEVPCFEAAGLTFDGNAFWVADYSKRTVYHISMGGEVLGAYETPYSTPFGLAWDGHHLWVLDVFGLEEYPDLYANVFPNSFLYKFDPETGEILDRIESPASFGGDIAYKEGEIIVAGVTSRKVFHIDVKTKNVTFWYYPPDTLPRAVAVGEGNNQFISGMTTREIWEVNLDKRAQYKDAREESKVIIPFWLILVTCFLLLPIFFEELMTRKYPQKESAIEKLFTLITGDALTFFLFKVSVIAIIIYFVSNYMVWRRVTAVITSAFLELFGFYTTIVTGSDFVFLEGCAIKKACLLIGFIAIIIGIIWATKISLKKKVLLSLLGTGIMSAWNIVRLSIYIVLIQRDVPYLLAHDVFFYIGGVIITVAVLKVCSFLSPEMGRELSHLGMLAKETFIKSRKKRV